MKYHYIITAKRGSETVYYCNSDTQGIRMVPNAYSYARQLHYKAVAETTMVVLKDNFKGLTDWEIKQIYG